jgi:glycosyltransferase involved in cell wall biosynthesis
MTRAIFIVTNPVESPGDRYRIYQYLPYFEKNGVECFVSSLFTSSDYELIHRRGHTARKILAVLQGFGSRIRWLLKLKRMDIAVVYRDPIFFWPGLIETLLGTAGVPYILDFDDAIYLPPPGANPLASLFRPPGSLRRTIRRSACTVVGNRVLADYAGQFSDNVVVIPTCVDIDRFRPRNHTSCQPNGELVIGWMGSHSTAPYLLRLNQAFVELAREFSNLKLLVVGGEYRLPGVPVECRPWSLEREVADLRGFDVGVMPLPDDPWTRGKCGLKILQYMAVAVPVVASPVGVNKEIIQDGENGFLAAETRDWVGKLSRLAGDPGLRARLGKAGRTAVEERYSSSHAASLYLALIRSVVGKTRGRACAENAHRRP